MDPSANDSAVKPGSQHTVSIERFTIGGFALAHVGDTPVRVLGAIPGQTVEIRITKKRDAGWEAKTVNLVKQSKDSTQPRGDNFRGCGMHNIAYDKQISYKEDIVRETLETLTPVSDDIRASLPGRVLPISPSPQVWHYRNKLEMSFGYEHMRVEKNAQGKKKFFDENPCVGFHPPGSWATVYPVNDCALYDEQLPMLLQDVNRFMEKTNLPVYNPKTHKGMLRLLLLRRGVNTGQQMIAFIVQARKKELEPLFQHFMQFGGRSGLTSLMVIEHMGLNDKPDNPKIHTLVGQPFITERLFDLEFQISPFSFFQTNTLCAEKLYQAIAEGAALTSRDTVLDAYCGMGTIGQYLARFCEKVVGVESAPSAIDDALKSASHNRIGNISFYKGRTEQVLHQQLKPGGKYQFSTIVVDPPRAGLHPRALDALIDHKPEKIVYVSCNVSTFARDLGHLLKNGYELRTVQPVDMFPHTPHVEVVGVLQRG